MEGKIVTVVPKSSNSIALVNHRGRQMQVIKVIENRVLLANPESTISWTAWLNHDEALFLIEEGIPSAKGRVGSS